MSGKFYDNQWQYVLTHSKKAFKPFTQWNTSKLATNNQNYPDN